MSARPWHQCLAVGQQLQLPSGRVVQLLQEARAGNWMGGYVRAGRLLATDLRSVHCVTLSHAFIATHCKLVPK